ncbi:TPA: hypothetical protein ACVAA3_007979, partial [Burkholderia contaminans]
MSDARDAAGWCGFSGEPDRIAGAEPDFERPLTFADREQRQRPHIFRPVVAANDAAEEPPGEAAWQAGLPEMSGYRVLLPRSAATSCLVRRTSSEKVLRRHSIASAGRNPRTCRSPDP